MHGGELMAFGMTQFKAFNPKDYEEFTKMLDSLSATAKETKGDTAVVEIKMGGQPMPMPFKKVDGRWVPVPMAEEWAEGIADAEKEIQDGIEEAMKNKEMVKPIMEQILAGLTEFESSGDLDKLMGLMGGIGG